MRIKDWEKEVEKEPKPEVEKALDELSKIPARDLDLVKYEINETLGQTLKQCIGLPNNEYTQDRIRQLIDGWYVTLMNSGQVDKNHPGLAFAGPPTITTEIDRNDQTKMMVRMNYSIPTVRTLDCINMTNYITAPSFDTVTVEKEIPF